MIAAGLATAGTAMAAPTPVTITGGPGGPTNDTTPTFTWNVAPETTVACRVDDEPFAACSGPESSHTTEPLPDGPHTFEVRAGGTEETYGYDQRSFTVDTVPPTVTLTTTPPSPSDDPTPTWSFTADDPTVAFYCIVLGDRDWSECGNGPASDYTTHPVPDGDHGFIVTAFDEAGNAAPYQGDDFTIDTAFPVATITGARRTRDRTPTFSLTADPGSTFRCSLNGRAFRPCASTVTLGPLKRGFHDFEVEATDPTGNVQPVPSYARLAITPIPCSAYRKHARRVACRCSKLRNKAKRSLCRCNRFKSKAKRKRCRANVSRASSAARPPGSNRAR